MSYPAYMTIKGTRQDLITAGASSKASVGNAYQEDHQDKILVQAINHSIFVQGRGEYAARRHEPLIITKVIDKSTPLLNIAMCNSEALIQCRLEWYRTVGEGGMEHYFTTELEGAVIVGIEVLMPHSQDAASAQLTHLERIHIAYRKISWAHETARTLGMEEWNQG
ncbi:Hcp family type VI secretion system effector [Pseudomonas sp. NA-150]|uniref:Hcp family type VI secretion system effector n=1 Tax=Pseudomonas sp. NA-150 TaxID=3367525 RepID=UPI0037C59E0C